MKQNNKTFIALMLMIGFNLTVMSNNCIAGGWKDLKNSLKSDKDKKAAKKLVKQALRQKSTSNNRSSNKSTSSQRSTSVSGSRPNPELRNNLLKCDDVNLKNVQIGNSTSYEVTEGLSKSNYTGFINRRPATVTNQCFIGVLDSDECATMEITEAELKQVTQGDRNSLKMQCIFSNEPSKIANQEVPYRADNIPLNYMLLKCGHDQGNQYPCDEGSNSSRSGKYKKQQLKGKTQLSVCATKYHLVKDGGQHIYCQYYNKKSKKSLFAFEFFQSKD